MTTTETAADPWTTPERVAMRQMAREFVRREIAPHMAEWEAAGELPRALHRKAAAVGLLGTGFAEEVGGGGGNAIDSAIVMLTLARLWLSLAETTV